MFSNLLYAFFIWAVFLALSCVFLCFHFFHKSFTSGETVGSDTNGELVDIVVTPTFSGYIHPVALLRSSFQIFTRTKESAQHSQCLDTNDKILASLPI